MKYSGSISLFERSVGLIRETFTTSAQLHGLHVSTARGSRSINIDDHLSHTTVALEGLISAYLVGAYIAKRKRFEYFRPLIRLVVTAAGHDYEEEARTVPLVMWPLRALWGEPEALHYHAGRIDLCLAKMNQDAIIAGLFGSEEQGLRALIELELLVDLNSFLAVDKMQSPGSAAHMEATFPGINFVFRPSLIAFDLRYIVQLAGEIFANLRIKLIDPLSRLLFDTKEAEIFCSSGKEPYLKFLRYLINDHGKLMLQLNRFSSYVSWPADIQDALRALPRE